MRIVSGKNIMKPQEITVTTNHNALGVTVLLIGSTGIHSVCNMGSNTISNTSGITNLNIKLGL